METLIAAGLLILGSLLILLGLLMVGVLVVFVLFSPLKPVRVQQEDFFEKLFGPEGTAEARIRGTADKTQQHTD